MWRDGGGLMFCRTVPSWFWIDSPTWGAHQRPAVGQRGVGDGELERGHLHVTLADGEVDVVADGPRAVGPVGGPTAAQAVLGLALVGPGA